jgi:hypothetical protein
MLPSSFNNLKIGNTTKNEIEHLLHSKQSPSTFFSIHDTQNQPSLIQRLGKKAKGAAENQRNA